MPGRPTDTQLDRYFGSKILPDGTVKLRRQADSDTQHVGPRRRSTTISCASITPIFVNLTIPSTGRRDVG